MVHNKEADAIILLFENEKAQMYENPLEDHPEPVLAELTKWLSDRGFPTDNLEDIVSRTWVNFRFAEDCELFIFHISYVDGEKDSYGSVIFSFNPQTETCHYGGNSLTSYI